MQKTLFAKFAAINAKYQEICEAREAIRMEIVEEMRKEKVDKAETDYGIFTIARKVSWLYTKAVGKLEEKVKLAKLREEKKGLAERSETEYLRFTSIEK